MPINLRSRKLAFLLCAGLATVSIVLVLNSLMDWCDFERTPPSKPENVVNIRLRTTDHGTHLAYVPAGLSANRKYPLVFALSPSADAYSMISKWSKVADKRLWIVASSKEVQKRCAF